MMRVLQRTALVVLLAGSGLRLGAGAQELFPASAGDGRAETVIAPPPAWTQPANLGLLKQQLDQYVASGDYLRDVAMVDGEVEQWLAARAPLTQRPALVLDIDETSLSNLPEIKAQDYGYVPEGACDHLPAGPCGFNAWAASAQAPALAPTLHLAQMAQKLGVAVFFVTGRKQSLQQATEQNLRRAGYADWQGLSMEPVGSHYAATADFKAPARAGIEAQGYVILATVGDQKSDLSGGHAERGFQLPNPFYYLP